MSNYTTQLRYLMEANFDLGLNSYPIFKETYREILNKKIVDHYYFREIGLETAGMFKHFLRTRMNEIMVYYNQLYESEFIKIEPLTRLDYSEEYDFDKRQTTDRNVTETDTLEDDKVDNFTNNQIVEGVMTSSGDSTSDSNSTSRGKGIESDTPTGSLDFDTIETGIYASKVNLSETESKDNSISNTNTNSINKDKTDSEGIAMSNQKSNRDNFKEDIFQLDDTESYLKRIFGNNAMRTDSEMLIQFRETFLNIDLMIINDLEDLFMQIW